MDPNILWWGGLGLTWVVALTGGAFALLAWRRTQEYPDTRDLDQAVDAARRAGREVRNYDIPRVMVSGDIDLLGRVASDLRGHRRRDRTS